MSDKDQIGNVPEERDGNLDCNGLVLCCAFNRLGTLLAGGCNDGRVAIWDFVVRCMVREIQAHVYTVTSVSWSMDGRWLSTTSLDNTLAVWDVYPDGKDTPELVVRSHLCFPILKAQFHPKNKNLLLVCPNKHVPILINIIKVTDGDYRLKYTALFTHKDEDVESNIAASFDKDGHYIYTGNARGVLTVMKTPEELPDDDVSSKGAAIEVVSSFKIQQVGVAPAIRDIEFSARNAKFFLVNSTDRSIRLYHCSDALAAGLNGTCGEKRKFQELVDKPLWKKCCFSGDSDVSYVCGGSASRHAIYIWDIETGAVKKMLQHVSEEETLMDVQWHPTRPIVVSVSFGMIFVWARAEMENWSAYAPTFQELDENQEYDERESEFDIEDEDADLKTKSRNDDDNDEYNNIDVVNVDHEEGDCDEGLENSNVLGLIPLAFAEIEKASQIKYK